MRTLLILIALITLGIEDMLAAPPAPIEPEFGAVIKAAVHYKHHKDTNDLGVIESFYVKCPNCDAIGLSTLPSDAVTRAMFYRLFQTVPNGAMCRKWIIHKLALAPESEAPIKLFIETAINKQEDHDTRIAAINDLMLTRWTNAQSALAEVFLKINEEKYRDHMLGAAVNTKRPVLTELLLGYYRHFHPDKEYRYVRHHALLQELKAKMAEDAKNPKPDPLALARAENEWWDKFIKKERTVTLAEAKTGLANFAKAPVLERLELAYAIRQSVAPDAELVKRLEHLIPDEPSALVKSAMIDTVAMSQPNVPARLQYYRHLAAKEKNDDVMKYLKNHIKLIEDGIIKR